MQPTTRHISLIDENQARDKGGKTHLGPFELESFSQDHTTQGQNRAAGHGPSQDFCWEEAEPQLVMHFTD